MALGRGKKMMAVVVAVILAIHFTGAMALDPTVIVIGAGMSGISAAKTLSDAGIKNILILEATDRIGGRIHKTNFAGLSVEMGANWVEGVNGPQVNPIWPMVNKLKLKTFFSNYDNLSSNTYQQTGGLHKESFAKATLDMADKLSEFSTNVSTSLTASRLEDISILASQRLMTMVPSTPIEMAVDYYKYDYEFAEPPRVTSLQNTEPLPTFTNFGDDLYFVADSRGYESVVYDIAKQFLATNSAGKITDPRLKLNKVVTEIRYSRSGVIVKTEDGSIYRGGYVMVSASIGVLQTNLINFQPDLPRWKILAIYQFDMAIYTKIFLKFPYKFWPTGNGTEFFLYAHEKRGYYPIWQQLERAYPGSNALLVTVTDDESRRIEQQPDSETKAEIMEVLRSMFGKNIPDATDILVPRWWSNRFYKGTYSNWPIGVSRYEYEQIRAPVGRVYFTGEHTSEYYNGYVHGAYLAGIDSANMMIGCIQKKICKFQIKPKGT
ncbi:polyamine oxidase 1-like isoform X1 [Magnolia sinica]|uniref:polyamine oxidase 1-like isoform X1 n=1 Tax=Magnolia sinica TaxID=86752 RepID=UPI002659D224|nr:polyamine oxidase 1-like isoform X1 [Magnolia sinica]